MTQNPQPDITAIVTSYFEEKSLPEFYGQLSAALRDLGRPYEIIMINDGSTDRTFDIMKELFEKDPNIYAIVDFFKNSGQLAAMTAGATRARGKAILFIDSDLQLTPKDLPRLVEKYDEGYDLVSGYRVDRRDSPFRVLPSKIANMIMRRVSQTTLSDFGCTFKLYNAKILHAFDLGPFKLFNTASVISRIGRWTEVPVTHFPRPYGRSGWTFRKLWQFNMENIVNLSHKPFQLIGGLCLLLAALVALRIGIDLVFHIKILSTVTNGLILNALAISCLATLGLLCIVGEFTIRGFLLNQRYPAYVERECISRQSNGPCSC
ncbi:MAG: glycosyltransferase family 2 protein [Candidatus Hydrogenedentes bacterium]|nr:glycosyltransferase family 2 protein [Candidatus Hydrogenedentota bacterium]